MCLGGNDISTSSTPKKTYEDIIEFVKLLENSGVNCVRLWYYDQREIPKNTGVRQEDFWQ